MGSSPLARGLPIHAACGVPSGRIIPARAGFTSSRRPPPWPHPDHPRSRGVYTRSLGTINHRLGSSPLARGLLIAMQRTLSLRGIIPARAGFTGQTRFSLLCGSGSSPLARGLPGSFRPWLYGVGIIPARAGFTGREFRGVPTMTDHPRSRGVYSLPEIVTVPVVGSSPLARGLRRGPAVHRRHIRIIPARAGFTGGVSLCSDRNWDHPRSRGVYFR